MEEYVLFSCDTKLCIPSLYIDPSIVDWFNGVLKAKNYSQYVKDIWNITIQNVDFNELSVKLIQFKARHEFSDMQIYSELKAFIKEMLIDAKLCMPWLPVQNFYCTQEDYADRVIDLTVCGLWDAVIEVSDYFPNWIEHKPLKLIKFTGGTFINYKEISRKFLHLIKFPLYLACAHPWHQSWSIDYFKYNTDFLAIDICSGEWKRTDAMHDFNIFDILSLDLALCDANDYLNSYIERLFGREFKFIKNRCSSNRLEHFDLERYLIDKDRDDNVDMDIFLYFIYSYGERLKTINWADRNIKNVLENRVYFFMIIKSIFPNIDIQKNTYVTLQSKECAPEQIIRDMKRSMYGHIILDISGYKHFSPQMLHKLLNMEQVARIEINVDLMENYNDSEVHDLDRYIMDQKTIYLYSETGGNVRNVESILKHVSQFHGRSLNALLCIIVNNCVIDNYEVFKDLEIYSFAFQNMAVSVADLRTFCKHQRNLKSLYFIDCIQFGDNHLTELLVHGCLNIKRLSVEGLHSVTINFYFQYAECQLKNKNLVDFQIRRVFPIIHLKSIELFQNLTYFRNERENRIDVRNSLNQIIDIYDLFYSREELNRDTYDFYT